MFGSGRELGSGESPKEAEGLPSRGPTWALASAFLLVNPERFTNLTFCSAGSAEHFGVGSSDWEGGGARPPDLRPVAGLWSGLSSTAAWLAREARKGGCGGVERGDPELKATLSLCRPGFPNILRKPE